MMLSLMPFEDLDDRPIEYLIPDLLPQQGKMIFSAYAKSGKTTTIMHLLRALARGSDFLGRPAKRIDGTAVYINLELTAATLRGYATLAGLPLGSRRLLVSNMLGKAIQMTELTREASLERDEMICELKEAECQILIIDCLSPLMAMSGGSSDDNDLVRMVLENIDAAAREASVELVMIVDHTGHEDKSRSRGASAKLDWPDVTWNLVRAASDDCTLTVGGRIEETKVRFRLDKEKNLLIPAARQVDATDTEISRLRQQGMTEREIADQVGLHQSTVHRRLKA